MDIQDLHSSLSHVSNELSELLLKLPGSAIVLRYIKSSYQDDPIRSAIELFLVLFALRYLLAPSYSTQKTNNVKLTEAEIDELVDEWTPEPLVAPLTPAEEAENEKRPVISGPTAPKCKLSNGRTVTNLASYNYYNFLSSESLKEKAIQTLRTYGVGPCGPPGFYGTQDVHMKTEADIAAHLGVETAIVYAQAFSTISSVIPAFSKRGDIIVADKAVNFAIRKGLQISRSMVRWYAHNDLEDMERVLATVVKEQEGKPLTRRFIVTEGLFEDIGDMVDLPKIIKLKYRYKFRLILDETWSYGVLGRHGEGLTSHQNIDPTTVDMIIGSLAGPLCAGGGFCAGSAEVTEHQRISALAYTYSAALPAMLATTASETINLLQSPAGEELLGSCRELVKVMWGQLDPRSEWVRVSSVAENPMMLLVLKQEIVKARGWGAEEVDAVLGDVVDECLANGVLISRRRSMPASTLAAASKEEKDFVGCPEVVQPALRVCITTGLTRKEVERAGVVVRHAVTKVLKARRA